MKKYAVIVAGGSGTRMGATIPKQFLLLHSKPVLWHTLNTFLYTFNDLQIILVLPAAHLGEGAAIVETLAGADRIKITAGGNTRFQSVKNGLQFVSKNAVVFVHDGVRCLVTPDLITRCYTTTLEKGNAIPATTAVDSIRIETNGENSVIERSQVRIIQTPQTFLSDILLDAFDQEYDPAFTDEAIVVERMNIKINLIEGDAANIKITNPIDLLIAEKLLLQSQGNS